MAQDFWHQEDFADLMFSFRDGLEISVSIGREDGPAALLSVSALTVKTRDLFEFEGIINQKDEPLLPCKGQIDVSAGTGIYQASS
jgi:hypothetical protein